MPLGTPQQGQLVRGAQGTVFVPAGSTYAATAPASTNKAAAAGPPDDGKVHPMAQSMYQFGYGSVKADGSQYAPGEYAQEQMNDAMARSNMQKMRTAPQGDLTGANRASMEAGGLLGQAGQVGQQQQALATQLTNTANGTAGPTLAQLEMQRASGDAQRQQLAMAASGTGPSQTAALINAQNQNAAQQGQLQQNLGIQGAQEQWAAQQQLANVLGGIRGQTGQEAQTMGQLGQIAGQQALSQAQLQAQQNQLNQQGEQYYYGQGANWQQQQAALNAQAAANWNNFYLGQSSNAIQQQQVNNQQSNTMLGAGLSAAGTVAAAGLTAATGGAAAPVLGAAVANDVAQANKNSSDIRKKTDIAPAGESISNAYRGIARANDQAGQIRNANVEYPSPFAPLSSSSYHYRDPNAPGAAPGQQFGPMAQELERTPAGRTAVTTMPDGSKGIDTGRLSLMNASQTAENTRKLDALQHALDLKEARGGGGVTGSDGSYTQGASKEKKNTKLKTLVGDITKGANAVAEKFENTPVVYPTMRTEASSQPLVVQSGPQPMQLAAMNPYRVGY